ncbi:hypothetical protein [Flavobacterium akiainvivens]|uniref:hypothetical protein n=1 Tax=Flavobacterium akiainvivens TaxID=1202724 RepID=UPI001364CD9F|nr:hypothetical protein [Flavobacterium akiainvivens]
MIDDDFKRTGGVLSPQGVQVLLAWFYCLLTDFLGVKDNTMAVTAPIAKYV